MTFKESFSEALVEHYNEDLAEILAEIQYWLDFHKHGGDVSCAGTLSRIEECMKAILDY